MLNNDKEVIVVTAGEGWVDIDALACIVAYSELLNLKGKHAVGVLSGPTNATVPREYRAIAMVETEPPKTHHGAVIVDVSDPEYVAAFVSKNEVQEIFDHHPGFESFWKEKLGASSHIEMIGACATLIWEEIERTGMVDKIQKNTAKLIAAAIASNTLNFQIAITSSRDQNAFKTSSLLGGFDEATQTDYFAACESGIIQDISNALHHDTKHIRIPAFTEPITIGQLELLHSEPVIRNNADVIKSQLSQDGSRWLLDAPSIGDGYTLLYCIDENLRSAINNAIRVTWNGDFGKTERIMLRKEIVKALQT